ncbi:MAG: hypothetical protein NC548_32400 [Lachnospiraceae bacterium]|nr:hypothetical protein [Lachnospiraceae bacterium]
MKIEKIETKDRVIITAKLSLADILILFGAFVLVVAAVGFGLIKIGG